MSVARGGTLQRLSLREQALTLIKERLITGEIAPGSVRSASGLASELGVSNSPVREAMLALVEEGLMEPVPNRGFRAVSLTDRDLDEILDLRMLLEVPAMGRVARMDLGDRLTELMRLVEAIERTARDGDVAGNLAADRDFHLHLLEVCGNRRLIDCVAHLRDQTRLDNLRMLAATGQLVASASEHRPLLDAITNHDSGRAEELTRKHLSHARSDWSITSTEHASRPPHRRRGDR